MGAWIETLMSFTSDNVPKSHPTWVRGLKLRRCKDIDTKGLSHPTWVRGLKPLAASAHLPADSRTLRGCVD